ncbi:MAG TPA: bacillithiol biosynthesis cysteine-adding enzyme BshC [Longimicrobium sp.]
MTLRIDAGPIRGSRLVDDYLADKPAISAFYAGHPLDPAAYRVKLAEVQGRFPRAARERAASALRPTSPGAAERLRRFVEEGGAMVTTGQQAGLFTGPLYTIHKILSAIRLAEALERELGTIVLPVFWAASEDHDFAEVNHAWAVGGAGELLRFEVEASERRPVPMCEMRLGRDAENAFDEFVQAIGGHADDGGVFTRLRAAYQPGRTVAEAFRDSIAELFAGFDLLVTDAADPALKAASAGILLAEAEHAGEHERLVAERTAELAAAGYPSQVVVAEGATNLFFHGPAGRERLQRDGTAFVANDARRRFTREELGALLRDDPRALSPNVFLRPVVESAVFPTLAYVGGPAETAYFAQIGPLFDALGIGMPLVFPRFAALIAPPEAEEARDALAITDEELRLPEHELVERVARRRMPAEVERELAVLRHALVGNFGTLIDAAHGIDPNLDLAIGARRNRALIEVAGAERKIIRHVKRNDPVLRRAPLARNHLRPRGLPQERVLTVFQYLARQPSLLHDLAAAMNVELTQRHGDTE